MSNIEYIELHTHLYGSIPVETLFEIGKNNPSPRWNIFIEPYEKLFNIKIDPKNFFKEFDSAEKLKSIYYFLNPAPFEEFQAKFNLIIALSVFNKEEIKFIAREVLGDYAKKNSKYCEFRIMYSPLATEVDYYEKTLAACEGLQEGEKIYSCKGRLVVSLHRRGNYEEQYGFLKKMMEKNPVIAKYLVGIDFCHIEEGNPPKEKKEFFKKVLLDNYKNSKNALSILYHVGESFIDKTHLSACRWIYESAVNGAHRLGHCIALGENLNKYYGKTREETREEFIDTNEFIINHFEDIKAHGKISDINYFKENLEKIRYGTDTIVVMYDKIFVQNLDTFRKFVIEKLIKEKTIIESCPSSNYLIGMVDKYDHLPIKFFSETNLRLTIGADDPGILNTDIVKEYQICREIHIKENYLNQIREVSKSYTSEILSGRVARPEGFEPPTL